ncbi:hypothetical protein ADUPG1_008534 [Aduncisulcus paluster]|uniref:Uncharacterized protein n=1 Tax=Aduncisulcus paluster TaxID=2918883 RepID=A0ABQ5KSC3_9EUKA|nr:hypothetical protein ADUPG1_008534 [Aduncisulcus paluster]
MTVQDKLTKVAHYEPILPFVLFLISFIGFLVQSFSQSHIRKDTVPLEIGLWGCPAGYDGNYDDYLCQGSDYRDSSTPNPPGFIFGPYSTSNNFLKFNLSIHNTYYQDISLDDLSIRTTISSAKLPDGVNLKQLQYEEDFYTVLTWSEETVIVANTHGKSCLGTSFVCDDINVANVKGIRDNFYKVSFDITSSGSLSMNGFGDARVSLDTLTPSVFSMYLRLFSMIATLICAVVFIKSVKQVNVGASVKSSTQMYVLWLFILIISTLLFLNPFQPLSSTSSPNSALQYLSSILSFISLGGIMVSVSMIGRIMFGFTKLSGGESEEEERNFEKIEREGTKRHLLVSIIFVSIFLLLMLITTFVSIGKKYDDHLSLFSSSSILSALTFIACVVYATWMIVTYSSRLFRLSCTCCDCSILIANNQTYNELGDADVSNVPAITTGSVITESEHSLRMTYSLSPTQEAEAFSVYGCNVSLLRMVYVCLCLWTIWLCIDVFVGGLSGVEFLDSGKQAPSYTFLILTVLFLALSIGVGITMLPEITASGMSAYAKVVSRINLTHMTGLTGDQVGAEVWQEKEEEAGASVFMET